MNRKTASRLKSWLLNPIPLLGIWLRRRALHELTQEIAANGSPQALEVLAAVMDRLPDRQSQAAVQQILENVQGARQVDSVCQAWVDTRSANLARLIARRGWVASGPGLVRILSALLSDKLDLIRGIEAKDLTALLDACADPEPLLAGQAQTCLAQLSDQASIDALCELWARQRKTQPANPNPHLWAALASARYIASRPPEVRVLTALHCANPQALTGDGAEIAPPLAAALLDPDPQIVSQARSAITLLSNRPLQDAICQEFIHSPGGSAEILRRDSVLQEAIQAGGYLPHNPAQRALFFFLTDQWERYESLDYDQNQLRAVYDAASPILRERIQSRLRHAGRPGYLNILVGGDETSRLKKMSPAEIELMVQLLKREQQWARLWGLACKLPLYWGLQIVRSLHKNGWQPAESADHEVYTRLGHLSDQAAIQASREISRHMLQAIERARVHLLHGRLNDLAFAPRSPLIALGSSRRRVILWNYQTGTVQAKITQAEDGPFNHSIGEIAYTGQGELVFAERTRGSTHCRVYLQRDGQPRAIYTETGSITGLEPVGENGILLTGRSQFVSLLDVSDLPQQVQRRVFPVWARATAVHPSLPVAALLHQSAELISLPDLQPSAPGRSAEQMINCGAFLPDSEDLLVGKLTGEILLLPRRKNGLGKPEPLKALRHEGRVTGLAALRHSPVVISAGEDGLIHFMGWPDKRLRGQVGRPGEIIQSLHVSADESFLAVVHSDTHLTLWDLRIQTLPAIFSRPLLAATPGQLAVLQSIATSTSSAEVQPGSQPTVPPMPPLTPAGTRALSAAILLLQHRLRHDIELEMVAEIKMGEFDIEIE